MASLMAEKMLIGISLNEGPRAWSPREGSHIADRELSVSARASTLRGEDLPHRVHRIRVFDAFVGAVTFDARESQRQATRISRARLQIAERDLHHDLGPHVQRPRIAVRLAREELARLPLEHDIGE